MSHGNLVICVPHGVWDCNQCSQEKADEASRALAASHQRLKEALWVCAEHNALHFGENHNTVIQAREALRSAP